MASPLSTRDLLPLEVRESSSGMDADDDYDVLGSPGIEIDELDEDIQVDGEKFSSIAFPYG